MDSFPLRSLAGRAPGGAACARRSGLAALARVGAASSLLPLVLAAACAGAQEPPPRDPAPAEEVRPPETAGTPSIRPEWVRAGVRSTTRENASVVSVSGMGRVEVEPDRARILFAVETEAGTAGEAGERNARLMTEVTAAVGEAGAGVAGFSVETAGYALMPQYGPVRDGRSREIVGYVARNSIRVSVDEVGAAGRLIDAALEAGANRVSSLQFELRDPEPHRHRAVAEAIRSARAEAEVMAAALGLGLGPVLAVEGGADMPSPRAFQVDAAAVRLEATPTPIEPGLQSVTARVTLRFRLTDAQ